MMKSPVGGKRGEHCQESLLKEDQLSKKDVWKLVR
jgi:hypothetical protein